MVVLSLWYIHSMPTDMESTCCGLSWIESIINIIHEHASFITVDHHPAPSSISSHHQSFRIKNLFIIHNQISSINIHHLSIFHFHCLCWLLPPALLLATPSSSFFLSSRPTFKKKTYCHSCCHVLLWRPYFQWRRGNLTFNRNTSGLRAPRGPPLQSPVLEISRLTHPLSSFPTTLQRVPLPAWQSTQLKQRPKSL